MNESSSSDCEYLFDRYQEFIANKYPLINSGEFYRKVESKKKIKK